MNIWTCTRQGELYHHGIKGQKWGVRRFQNKDGSLTPAGKRRYDEPNVGRDNTTKVKTNGKKQKQYKIPENKSLHRLKLEEKYMKNGMTREEAEQAAAKRIRTEKFVAGAAVVTVASAVAYAKYKGYTSDKTMGVNSEFQRVMRLTENAEIRKDNRQYLSFDKKDKIKYKGLLADNLNKTPSLGAKQNIYDVTVKNKDVVKIASEKRARDTFAKLYEEDREFRRELIGRIDLNGSNFERGNLGNIIKKVRNGETLTKNDLRGKGYDLFNIMLVDNSDMGIKNSNRFYDALRKQGINAIIDVNDRKYSGFKAKMPIITFDGDFDYTKRAMDDIEIQKNLKKATVDIFGPEIAKAGALYVGMYGAAPVINKVEMDKKVLQYKQDHPNTNLSDKEIKAMIKEELQKGGENSK